MGLVVSCRHRPTSDLSMLHMIMKRAIAQAVAAYRTRLRRCELADTGAAGCPSLFAADLRTQLVQSSHLPYSCTASTYTLLPAHTRARRCVHYRAITPAPSRSEQGTSYIDPLFFPHILVSILS